MAGWSGAVGTVGQESKLPVRTADSSGPPVRRRRIAWTTRTAAPSAAETITVRIVVRISLPTVVTLRSRPENPTGAGHGDPDGDSPWAA